MTDQDLPSPNTHPQAASTHTDAYRFPLGIFLVLGPLLGIGFILAFMAGLFEEWHLLNPPPSRPLEFTGISVYFYQADPYVIGQDGNPYFCDILPGNVEQQPLCAWRIQPPPMDILEPGCQPGGI